MAVQIEGGSKNLFSAGKAVAPTVRARSVARDSVQGAGLSDFRQAKGDYQQKYAGDMRSANAQNLMDRNTLSRKGLAAANSKAMQDLTSRNLQRSVQANRMGANRQMGTLQNQQAPSMLESLLQSRQAGVAAQNQIASQGLVGDQAKELMSKALQQSYGLQGDIQNAALGAEKAEHLGDIQAHGTKRANTAGLLDTALMVKSLVMG